MTIIDFTKVSPKNQPKLYKVDDIRTIDNISAMRLIEISHRHPRIISVGFDGNRFSKPTTIDVGDKVQISILKDQKRGCDVSDIIGGFGYHFILDDIKIWKPNVVSLEGWRNINTGQTRFQPRVF